MSTLKENVNISAGQSSLQRSSLLSPATEPSTELSAGDILASRITSQNIPLVQSSSKKENVLETPSSKERLFENRSSKVLFENSSSEENKSENVQTSSRSKQLSDLSGVTLQSELSSSGESDRKRKSDEKLEGRKISVFICFPIFVRVMSVLCLRFYHGLFLQNLTVEFSDMNSTGTYLRAS